MKKGKPATLTSSLLARKGEAEPARLADGTVPKDVMALHEEIVARVAADIARGPSQAPASNLNENSEARPSGEPMPDDESAEPAEPSVAGGEAAQGEASESPPAAFDEGHPGPDGHEDAHGDDDTLEESKDREAIEEADPDEAAFDGTDEAARVTLADWAATPAPDAPDSVGGMLTQRDEAPPPDRARFMPIALGVGVAVILSAWAVLHLNGRDEPIPEQTAAAPQAALPQAVAPEPAAPAASETAPALPSPVSEAPKSVPAMAKPPVAKEPTAKAPATKPAAARPAEAKAVPAKTATAAGAPGHFSVQLLSATTEAEANHRWTQIAARFPAIVEGHGHAVQRADLGSKGVYYRVRLTGLSAATARATCEAFRVQHQECLVVKK